MGRVRRFSLRRLPNRITHVTIHCLYLRVLQGHSLLLYALLSLLRGHLLPLLARGSLLLQLPAWLQNLVAIAARHCLWVHFLELRSDFSNDLFNLARVRLVSSRVADHLAPLNSLILARKQSDDGSDQDVARKVDSAFSVQVLFPLREFSVVLQACLVRIA